MEFKQLLLLLLVNSMYLQNGDLLKTEDQHCEFIVTFDYEVTNNSLVNGIKEYQVEVRKDLSNLDKKKLKDYTIDRDSLEILNNCYQYQIGQNQSDNGVQTVSRVVINEDLVVSVTFKENGGSHSITFIAPAIPSDGTSKDTTVKDVLEAVQNPKDKGQFLFNQGSGKVIFLPLQNKIKVDTLQIQSQNCQQGNNTPTYKDLDNLDWINCVSDGIELHNFWYNSLSSNWAFWLWVFILMSFFLVSVFQEEEMDPTYNREEAWTHHPVYSIRHCITGMFWKRQRLALLYVEICAMCLILSLLTWKQSDEHFALIIIVFPLCACILSFIPSFIAGVLLRRYINTFRVYIQEYKSNQNMDYQQRNIMLDRFHSTNYRTIVVFYAFCALFCIGCNAVAIYVLRYKSFIDMWWYILLVALGVAWNLLFFNILFVIMAKGSEGLHNFLMKRGYYYEKELNDDYREYFKIE